MKRAFTTLCVLALMAAPVFGADNAPQIQIRDGKVSMHAEQIPLGRLLGLLDRATGMTSTVPPEAANQRVSVQFSNLDFNEAVDKIFEGRSVDYMLIAGEGIKVTALAGSFSVPTGPASSFGDQSPFMNQPAFDPFVQQQDNQQPVQVMPPMPPNVNNVNSIPPGAAFNTEQPGQQPAVIQTPFGPIPNPRAGQPMDPVVNGGAAAQQQQPPAQNNNSLFGNTSPQMFGQGNQQQQQQQQPGQPRTLGPSPSPLFPQPGRQ